MGLTADADGFDVAFDWSGKVAGDGSEIRLGIYDGDAGAYPLATDTILAHGSGNGPALPLVGADGADAGHYAGTFPYARTSAVTLLLFTTTTDGPQLVEGATFDALALQTGTPTLTGTFVVGTDVQADPGTWTSGAVLTYRWFRDGEPLSEQTTSSSTWSTPGWAAWSTSR